MSSIIGYENILDAADIVTSSEAAGSGIITYAGANAYDNNTSDHWKPAVVPAYITVDTHDGFTDADYFAVSAHDGATQGSVYTLQYADFDAGPWTTVSTITPTVDGTIAKRFTLASNHRYWRVEMSAAISSLGYVAFGRGLILPREMPIGYGAIHDSDDATVINAISENGSFIGRSIISTGKSGTIQIRDMSDIYERANWPKLKAYIRTKPFIFIWDDARDEAVLCWLKGNVPTPVYSRFDKLSATLQVEGL